MDINKGLTKEQVAIERNKNGSNVLVTHKSNSFFKLLLETLGDPIIRILLIALAVKTLFLFKDFDWYETIGILIAILLASFISSISEYGSEAAFKKLQEESSKIKTKVLRDGKTQEIDIEEVVTNDIVILQMGDKVPADGVVVEGSLLVDESMLNGEKKEAKKINGDNIYRGSVIYANKGKIRVTAVGSKTMYGNIAEEIQEKEPKSPLKIRLAGFAKVISRIGYFGAGLVSLSYLFKVIVLDNNFNWGEILNTLTNFHLMADYLIYALTLSVTIIVVAVPEGLPVMITLVLSSNMKRMLKDNVLVRKLVGIETAGSLNVLLTDKTGTLTKGELEVTDIYSGDLQGFKTKKSLEIYPKYLNEFIKCTYYNNESVISDDKVIGGNSTDKAIMEYMKNFKIPNFVTSNKTNFDSSKKYSSVEIDKETYYKGACEKLLPKCFYYLDKYGERKNLTNKKNIENKINEFTKQGIRVLTLCKGKSKNLELLTFIGFICIKDDLRAEAKEGVSLIKNAGIDVIMITGDAKDTARSIAKEVGILNSSNDIVLTSDEFNKLSDEYIEDNLKRIKVIARALPTDKSRMVKIILNKDLIVGMTGDGVNDAPALKKANVGFAMGTGTEVAKEASDIVILDNNILSISKAILYGRTIFKSIRKFIIYQVTVNMCALVLSIVGPFIGIDTPITIIQMLWLNMIMDTFAALAFSFEPPLKDYMKEPPKKKEEPIMNKYMFGEILFTGLYSAIICILFLKLPIIKDIIRIGDNNKFLMTAYFALFIFIGIFNSFNARSTRLNIFANLKKNKVFLGMIIFITSVQIYLIYHGGDLFRTYGLTAKEFFFVLILAASVIPIDFLRKSYIRKKGYQSSI
ncbi:MAG: calcium-translocating P-type ATPase, PMCA-type [Bacilli bacterium]|nr:calcium-translocating P-type ATPase, PMCA-type [Bacilli bacterium]